MLKTLINPKILPKPRGFTHAIRVWPCGRLLFVAGQTGQFQDGRFAAGDTLGQFAQALSSLRAVIEEGGGRMDDVVQMRIYVTDVKEYRAQLKQLGMVWREVFGGYYPAMTLIEVKGLFEPQARVELEAIAALPPPRKRSAKPKGGGKR